MFGLNPAAVVLWAFCAVVGALFGSVLVGLAIGLGFSILVALIPDPAPRRRRRR